MFLENNINNYSSFIRDNLAKYFSIERLYRARSILDSSKDYY